MTSKINNVSDVFREAKTRLWDGKGDVFWSTDHAYICHAIEAVTTSAPRRLELRAKRIIQSRLMSAEDAHRTVLGYLVEVVGVPENYLYANKHLVQQYRRDWLTALEDEFKPKLKPKKGYSIHHIDGDVGNNDLINLIYVKTSEKSNWK